MCTWHYNLKSHTHTHTHTQSTCCSFQCLSSLNVKCITWLLLAVFRLMSCEDKAIKHITDRTWHCNMFSLLKHSQTLLVRMFTENSLEPEEGETLTAWVRASPCRVSTPFTWSMLWRQDSRTHKTVITTLWKSQTEPCPLHTTLLLTWVLCHNDTVEVPDRTLSPTHYTTVDLSPMS